MKTKHNIGRPEKIQIMSSGCQILGRAAAIHFPTSRRLSIFALTFVFLSVVVFSVSSQSVVTRHLAVEVGTDVVLNCTSTKPAIWSKIISDEDAANIRFQFIYIGKQLYDKDLGEKFSIRHTPKTRSPLREPSFDLFLSNATLRDSGKYLCNEDLAVYLTVIDTPSCTPNKNIHKENLKVIFKCKIRYSGLEGAPTLDWLLDDEVMYPNPLAGIENVRSTSIDDTTIVKTLEWKPRSEHNRRNVKCVVRHPHLKIPPDKNNSVGGVVVVDDQRSSDNDNDDLNINRNGPVATSALPFCGFTPLDVRFRPRVLCPHQFFVPQESYEESSAPVQALDGEDRNDDDDDDDENTSLVEEATIDDFVRRRRRARKRARRVRRRYERRHHHRLDTDRIVGNMKYKRSAAVSNLTAANFEGDDSNDIIDDVVVTTVAVPRKKRRLMFACEVYANPLPGEGSMYWKRGTDGDRIYVGSEDEGQVVLLDGRRTGGDRLKVGFYVPVEELSERLPHMRVALSVPLHGKSMMETVTDVHYVFGPYLSCPPHVYLSNKGATRGAAADRGGLGGVMGSKTFLITCRVRIHPPLEEGNVSWSLDGDGVSPVNSYVQLPMPPIGGGAAASSKNDAVEDDDEDRLTLVMLKLKEYQVQNRDAHYMLKLHVQGAHHHATSTLKIQWDRSGVIVGAADPDAPLIGSSSERFLENWIMNHAGLLVMGGVLLALGLLSGILLLVLYKQGFICSTEEKRSAAAKKKSPRNDKDRLSKAFPELFHSNRGHQRGEGHHRPHQGRSRHLSKSPQPQQPIGIIAHLPRERSDSGSPQTPRHQHLIIPPAAPETPGSRCKTPDSIDGPVNSAAMDKMTGLAKLGNALYLKDMDQDGFITVADGRSVLESYNGVYHLGITEARMTELLRLSSNGSYVNIEVIMRLLITSSQSG